MKMPLLLQGIEENTHTNGVQLSKKPFFESMGNSSLGDLNFRSEMPPHQVRSSFYPGPVNVNANQMGERNYASSYTKPPFTLKPPVMSSSSENEK